MLIRLQGSGHDVDAHRAGRSGDDLLSGFHALGVQVRHLDLGDLANLRLQALQ